MHLQIAVASGLNATYAQGLVFVHSKLELLLVLLQPGGLFLVQVGGGNVCLCARAISTFGRTRLYCRDKGSWVTSL